ncbi:cytochrome P450 [Pseudonocardia eucalypti]|uniref:Cytochrome P450 n=1 Tax=Pseudonocardia eucalypti TaxID=648755 RepID=A0ABP9Q757_9PSEU|nr:cytochrome P450 [Pseudonocardia eucalypti]
MTSTTREPVHLGEEFFADPHAMYAVLREQRPAVRATTALGLPIWLVTRYEEARAALNDPRLAKDNAQLSTVIERHLPDPSQRLAFGEAISAHMLSTDPPDHTRLRKLVNRGFTVRSVSALRPRIQATADSLVDAIEARVRAGQPTLDLLDAYAFPLPMTVIAQILGVGEEDRGSFRNWSNTLLSQKPIKERAAAGMAMAEYLTALVASKREQPGDDLLSLIVTAAEDADQLSEREAVSMAFLLLVAGHETTVNLIGNGMLGLLTNPDRLAELRADPGLVSAAVEEFLRFDGPLNTATFRHTKEPVTIGDVEIPAGEVVLVSLSSANRDPARFDRPDELDLARDTSGHLAFGYGIHHCLGAPLARLEGEIAFRTLIARFPRIRLAVDPAGLTWRNSMLIRGLDRLPVSLA